MTQSNSNIHRHYQQFTAEDRDHVRQCNSDYLFCYRYFTHLLTMGTRK